MSRSLPKEAPSLEKILKHGADPNSLTFEDSGSKRTLLCLVIEEGLKIDDFQKVLHFLSRPSWVAPSWV